LGLGLGKKLWDKYNLEMYFKSLGLMLLPCAEATSIYEAR